MDKTIEQIKKHKRKMNIVSRKNAEGEYRDVAHPINSDTRTQLQEMIMEKYREEIAEA